MPIIEPELNALRDNLLDMLNLVIDQIDKSRKAIQKMDSAIAEEVIRAEKKVNAQELSIDKDCANILALHTPVAIDLRFVLSTLRISNDLERIGDNIKSLARFVKHSKNVDKEVLEEFKLKKMLDVLHSMLQEMKHALKEDNASMAKRALKQDGELNQINKKALKTAEVILKRQHVDTKIVLNIFSMVRNLERCGNLTKNIGEEIVFHLEAEVLRHKKGSKK
jgi:phosphate transport system protein